MMGFLKKLFNQDLFVVTHQYGILRNLNQDNSDGEDDEDIPDDDVAAKLGPFQTYLALIKGYCAIVILLIPKAFLNGGYIFSPLVLLFSALLTGWCAIKLVDSGLKVKNYSYSFVAQAAYGSKFRALVDIFICLT
jgi:hypothetical protein